MRNTNESDSSIANNLTVIQSLVADLDTHASGDAAGAPRFQTITQRIYSIFTQ